MFRICIRLSSNIVKSNYISNDVKSTTTRIISFQSKCIQSTKITNFNESNQFEMIRKLSTSKNTNEKVTIVEKKDDNSSSRSQEQWKELFQQKRRESMFGMSPSNNSNDGNESNQNNQGTKKKM